MKYIRWIVGLMLVIGPLAGFGWAVDRWVKNPMFGITAIALGIVLGVLISIGLEMLMGSTPHWTGKPRILRFVRRHPSRRATDQRPEDRVDVRGGW